MAYGELPIDVVPVDDLLLDLENYRTGSQPSQAAAMADLFAGTRKTMQTAKNILINRYVDNELPLVFQEEEKFIVLEGNERVCALKALRDPSLAPSREGELRELLLQHEIEARDLPSSIRVEICPDREFAIPIIARLHTGEAKDAWGLDGQARFVMDRLEQPGMTYRKLQELIPDIKISRFIRMYEVRRLLQSLNYHDPELTEYVKSDKPTISALEYAYTKPEIRSIIGLKFDTNGRIVQKPSSPSELAAIERLMWWFAERKLNTNSLEFRKDTKEHKAFLADLKGEPLPDHDDLDDGSDQQDSDSPAPGGRGSNRQRTRSKLDFTGIYDEASFTGNFSDRIIELRSINLNSHPAAATMLLRSVVEESIRFHYRKIKRPFDKKMKLESMVHTVQKDYAREGEVVRAVNRLRLPADGQKPGSLDWFNVVSHSVDVSVKVEDVQEAWCELQSLVRFMLRD